MKDINLLNYLSENNIDIPDGFNISVVRLPSQLNKSLEINRAKEENRHANMKFTFSDPNYSGLGDKFEWAESCIIVSYSYISEDSSNLGSTQLVLSFKISLGMSTKTGPGLPDVAICLASRSI